MAWDGYFTYDGNEFINVSRTEQYAQNHKLHWLRPAYENEALSLVLGDGRRYTTPLNDDAPWVDPDNVASLDFFGLYPLDVSGIENSSRTSSPIESLGEGGVAGKVRNGTKEVVFSGLLIARNEAAAEYGMQWLKQSLSGGICGPSIASSCNGAELCYLSSPPELEEVDDPAGVMAMLDGGKFVVEDARFNEAQDGGRAYDSYSEELDGGTPGDAFLQDLAGGVAQGTSLEDLAVDVPDLDGGGVGVAPDDRFDGGEAAFTGDLISGQEWPFNLEPRFDVDPTTCLPPLLRSLRKVVINSGPTLTGKRTLSDGGVIWTVAFTAVAGSPYSVSVETPVIEGFLDPSIAVPWVGGVVPEGGMVDLNGFIHPEAECAVPVYEPVYDPLAPAIIPPPSPPSIPLGHYVPPKNWRRRQFTIPKQFIPAWGEVVPKVEVHATKKDLRNLRLRFYADPYGLGDITNDPCAYCGDLVISYVPVNHTLVLDGPEQVVYVVSPGGARRRADSLVFQTDGTPFEWPTLTCGFGYIVTVDLPQTQTPPVVDLSLFARAV